MSKKNEGSGVSNIATKGGQILQGKIGSEYDPSFRTKGKDSPVQRHRKKMPKNKALKHRSVEEAGKFDEAAAIDALGVNEVVRKKGNMWILFDDHTGVEVGSYKNRKAAWQAQRTRRQQRKFQTKQKKAEKPKKVKHAKSKSAPVTPKPKGAKKPAKAQVPQKTGTPKVKNVQGVKKIKPMSPLKPIRPKGLKAKSATSEAFTNAVGLRVLMETK